jgi:hypothetical protein
MASVNLDISSRLDITCRKNDTFSLDLNVKDASGTAIDLSLYEFKMEVRSSTDDSGTPVVASANVTATKNADSTTGKLNLKVSATNMNITAGTYVYDLQTTLLASPNTVQTWLFGTFTVNEDVTIT